ncbi:hypothetical protein HPB52_016637 [Rhipicephalus sanguineus]|uniref:Peptidase M13 N-terminal domain-containing protein n=1 Tax=Rhipicephalus sanguineus TaxID=34632 RepID=A0A9D4Q3Q6_RHISA|nr:hypothetical protein HPB52_016637 [Rhipicephalus sanguineus]
MASSANEDSGGDISSVPKPLDVRIEKLGVPSNAGSFSDTENQSAIASTAESTMPPADHWQQPDDGSPSSATPLRRQREPSEEFSATSSSSHAGYTRKRTGLYSEGNSREDKIAATTTATTTTKRGETPRARKTSAQYSGSAARNSSSPLAAESSRKALESPNKSSSQRKIESPATTTSTAGRDLEVKKRRKPEQERHYKDDVGCDMITFELQYQPREFSPSKGTTESGSRSTNTTRKGSVVSAQGQTRRTIREDAGLTVKPISELTSGVGKSQLSQKVKSDVPGALPKLPMETLGEQAARSSGGQSPKVHTFDVQFPLKKTRLSRDRHTLPAHETAPLIKSSDKRSSRLEQFRQAVAKAQSRSSPGLPTGDAIGDAVEKQELRRGWVWKKRGTRCASPPVQASRRGCHSSDIPDSQEPEQTVVQANEVWGPLVFRESFLYPLALALGVVLALVLTALFYPFGASSPSSGHRARAVQELPTCTSASCLQNAMYLDGLLSWDNVDPCDDFYAFVCRRWKSQFPAPNADYSVSSDDDYTAFLEERLRDMLRNASQTTRSLQPLQDLYGKCMDVKRTEDEGWNTLLELIFNVSLEGFPLTPPVRRSISVWKAAAKVLRKTGSCALLSAGVGYHPWALKDVVSVGAPELLTAKGGMDINEAVRLYTMAAFSATKTLKKDFLPPSLALSVVKFATEIEKLAELTLEKSRPVPYVLGSVPEVMDFVAEVFAGVKETPSCEADSDVLIVSPALVSKMLEIVKGAETHTVMNYLGVRLMIETSPFIPHSDLTDVYGALLYGKRRNAPPRWQLCIRVVEKALFPLVYFSLFTDLKLHVSVRRFVDLTREIIAEFARGINASSYFGNVSKAAIRNVISNTRLRVLGPDWLTDPALVDSFADKTPPITGSRRALESYVATYEYTFLDTLKRGSAQRWAHPTFSANCWYEHSTRTIYVPILVFNVTHAFDHTIDALQLSRAAPRLHRCVFDALLSEADSTNISDYWLTEGTRIKLQELESCFDVAAHKALPSFGRLRDSLAARLAYAHFQRSVKTSDRVLALRLQRGHVLNEARLFFVYLMLQTCENSGRLDTPGIVHAGQQWIIALRNGDDFADAYNCSVGTAMNPSSKCIS